MKTNWRVVANYSVFILFFLTLFYVFFAAKSALVPYIIGAIAAYVFYPVVRVLNNSFDSIGIKPSISRPVSIVTFIVLLIVFIGLFFWSVGDLLIGQLIDVGADVVSFFDQFVKAANFTVQIPSEIDIKEIIQYLTDNPPTFLQDLFSSLLSGVGSLVSVGISVFTVPFFIFYLLIDPSGLKKGLLRLIPNAWQPDFIQGGVITSSILNKYIKSQIYLAFIIFIISFIGFSLIGMPNAFALAFIAGILELVPIFGPIISWVIAFIVAIPLGLPMMIWVSVVSLIIQQLENNILVPRIQSETINFPAWIVMLLVVSFGALFGLAGMIIGLPVTAIFVSLIYYSHLRIAKQIKPEEATKVVQSSSIEFTNLNL